MNTYTHENINDPIIRAQVMRSQAIANALVEFFATVGEIFRPVVGRAAKYMEYRRVHATLSEMTDRELDDIGLCRGDIDAVAQGHDPRPQREEYLAHVLAQHATLEKTFTGEGEATEKAGANDNRTAAAAA